MEQMGSDGGGGSSSGGASSRWNPTKEQLTLLETRYSQGIRTPSSEQIQSITKKLQVYGHIEGKNVFYWFQNHKARLRQKQKMEMSNHIVVNNINCNNAAYFNNRFHYQSPPVYPTVVAAPVDTHPLFQAPPQNVAYSSYYIPQPEFGFYPNSPRMVLPNHILNNNNPMSQNHGYHNNMTSYEAQNTASSVGFSRAYPSNAFSDGSGGNKVTLNLFPVQPTGILQQRDQSPILMASSENTMDASEEGRGADLQPAGRTSSSSGAGFDFFSKMGSDQ